MSSKNLNILNWNVRGLNHTIRRQALRELVTSTRATVVCLQETKLQMIDDGIVRETLGNQFVSNYTFLPARDSKGGILIAATESHFSIISAFKTTNTLTTVIQMLDDGEEWSMTGVYGPQRKRRKLQFIEELKNLKSKVTEKWLLLGDFNLIYKAADKNNNRLDRRLM